VGRTYRCMQSAHTGLADDRHAPLCDTTAVGVLGAIPFDILNGTAAVVHQAPAFALRVCRVQSDAGSRRVRMVNMPVVERRPITR
jgi:hypothetical protein